MLGMRTCRIVSFSFAERAICQATVTLAVLLGFGRSAVAGEAPRATVGAYYFDGWAGKNAQAGKVDWAKDAPTHLTKRMLDEFPEREPVWGWRDDKLETMEPGISSRLGFFPLKR
jgi:hypothetical protein